MAQLLIGSPSAAPLDVSVAHSPQQSMYLLMRDAVSPSHPSARSPIARALRAELSASPDARNHAFALRPGRRGLVHGPVPNTLVPIPPYRDVDIAEQVAHLRDYPVDDLVADVAALGPTTQVWRSAADDPKRWLSAYADASSAAWRLLRPWWRSARRLIDQETERIGVASVRGGLDALLNTLSPRLRYADGVFSLGDVCPERFTVHGRRLVLVPSVIAPDAVFLHLDEPGLIGIAYPVRPDGADARTGPDRVDRLAVVIGDARAAVLRLVDVPVTMGTLAADLNVTPGAATRQCDLLERAGLIARERRGKAVLVTRTDAGAKLLDLLG